MKLNKYEPSTRNRGCKGMEFYLFMSKFSNLKQITNEKVIKFGFKNPHKTKKSYI